MVINGDMRRNPIPGLSGERSDSLHLHTLNPIKIMFATVRSRPVGPKSTISQNTARQTAFKLVMAAANIWRWLKSEKKLPWLTQGVTFKKSIEGINAPVQSAA